MNGIEAGAFLSILLVILGGLVVGHLSPAFFLGVYAAEDGIVEWLTVLVLLCGAVHCSMRLFVLRNCRSVVLLTTGVLAISFLAAAGEEISWGQRIFEFESPEFFARFNHQGETNLHNMVRVLSGVLMGVFFFAYVVVLPWLYLEVSAIRSLVNGLGIPVPRAHHVLFFFVLTPPIALIPDDPGNPMRFEVWEFAGALMLVLIAAFPRNGSELGLAPRVVSAAHDPTATAGSRGPRGASPR